MKYLYALGALSTSAMLAGARDAARMGSRRSALLVQVRLIREAG